MNIIKVGYVLCTVLIGLLLLNLQSISTYWQQTYHRSIPLSDLQELPFISLLKEINQWVIIEDNHYFLKVEEWNNELISQYNYFVIGQNAKQDNLDNSDKISIKSDTTLIAQAAVEPVMLEPSHIIDSSAGSVTIKRKKVSDSKLETTSGIVDVMDNPKNNHQDKIGSDGHAKEEAVFNQSQSIIVDTKDKILFIGDSLMQGVAPKVKRALYQNYHIESLDLSKQSTGLSYPKAFDWPKTVENILTQDPNIKVLVVFMGPNDPWDFPVKGQVKYLRFKSAEWESVYRERIERILSTARAHQIDIIWLGVPCMRKPKLHEGMLYLNTLYQSEVEKIKGHYIATSELLGCNDLKYSNSIRTDNGNAKVRIDDGIHFTVLGQRIIANRILDEIAIKINKTDEVPLQ